MKYQNPTGKYLFVIFYAVVLISFGIAMSTSAESPTEECTDECGCNQDHGCECDVCLPLSLMVEISADDFPAYFGIILWIQIHQSSSLDQEWYCGIDRPPRVS
jgi:hypothetical protein